MKKAEKNKRLFNSDFLSAEENQRIYDAESLQPTFGEKMKQFQEDSSNFNEENFIKIMKEYLVEYLNEFVKPEFSRTFTGVESFLKTQNQNQIRTITKTNKELPVNDRLLKIARKKLLDLCKKEMPELLKQVQKKDYEYYANERGTGSHC